MVIRKETALRAVAPNLMSHAFCPKLRIAVLASGGNLGTTPPRVESMISPFDRRILPIFLKILGSNVHPRSDNNQQKISI
jgi:hypothetical protein